MADLVGDTSTATDDGEGSPGYADDGAARDVEVDDPSSDLSSFQQRDSYFSIRYPSNWRAYESANDLGVTLAPEDGIVLHGDGRSEIVYGVIINHYVPFEGSVGGAGLARRFTAEAIPPLPDAPRSLEMATLDLVDRIRQTNPHLHVERRAADVRTVDGEPAVVLWMSGRNEMTERGERVTVVARKTEGDDHVIYALLIAPQNDYDRFADAFDVMLSTLRVDDRAIHRSR